jgi:phosphatidate phosphatase APP1
VLFGDSSHRDPEVYQTILDLYPERIVAVFIHKVNQTVAPDRVEGLHLHESYAEVAAILYGYQVITRTEAKSVMVAAAQEGLTITEAEMEALLDQHAP